MKNKTIIGIGKLLKSNVLLGASALGLLTSCGAYMNGYSETDGAYYDPTRDTVPQYDTRTAGNQVGGYYSYGDDEDETYDTSIVRQSQYNQKNNKQNIRTGVKRKQILTGEILPGHKPIILTTAIMAVGVILIMVGADGDLRFTDHTMVV